MQAHGIEAKSLQSTPDFPGRSPAEQSRIRQRAPKLKLFIDSMTEYL